MRLDFYLRSLGERSPSVGFVRWDNLATLSSVLSASSARLKAIGGTKSAVITIAARDLTTQKFTEALLKALGRPRPSTFLLIYDIEPFAGIAARVLNGFRERLGKAKIVLIFLRKNRFRDFAANAPDLLSWMGSNIVDACDLDSLLRPKDLRRALRVLEIRHGMSTKKFLRSDRIGSSKTIQDAWLWRELAAIGHDLRPRSKP